VQRATTHPLRYLVSSTRRSGANPAFLGDIAWIEEAAKVLEQEPIRLEFLEEALVA